MSASAAAFERRREPRHPAAPLADDLVIVGRRPEDGLLDEVRAEVRPLAVGAVAVRAVLDVQQARRARVAASGRRPWRRAGPGRRPRGRSCATRRGGRGVGGVLGRQVVDQRLLLVLGQRASPSRPSSRPRPSTAWASTLGRISSSEWQIRQFSRTDRRSRERAEARGRSGPRRSRLDGRRPSGEHGRSRRSARARGAVQGRHGLVHPTSQVTRSIPFQR